ncbi:MAG: flagellar basal body-associated FliL family protein [Candidatus Zixiibacteriota bacterium]
MAKEEEKTTVTTTATDAPPSKPAKSKKKLILFGGIGLGVILIGVALALFVLRPMMSSPADTKPADGHGTPAAKHVEAKKPESSHGASDKNKKGGHGEGGSSVYEIEDIVVNPAGTGGSRFLSVSFGFDVQSRELADEMAAREAQVRDVLITILSSKTVSDLTDPKQKEIMRLQIKKRLSQVLNTEQLAGVFYTDFVLQ